MRLASIAVTSSQSQELAGDGRLVVVSSDMTTGWLVDDERCLTMRRAIDNWSSVQDTLHKVSLEGSGTEIDLSRHTFLAPLPRATDFVDGSGYLSHILRVRKARGAEPPPALETDPLMYRGIPTFIPPHAEIKVTHFSDGPDCEAELAVIVGDVPAGIRPSEALQHVLLITQINDVSLRERIKQELPKQFGFLQSKPPSSAGPLAVTPDELGAAWNMGRPNLTMSIQRDEGLLGKLDTGELHFSFGDLIAHAACTHPLRAGTIIGTGTVSNADATRGVACVAEQVAIDTSAGQPLTPYFRVGERVTIETFLDDRSLFGRILNRFVGA